MCPAVWSRVQQPPCSPDACSAEPDFLSCGPWVFTLLNSGPTSVPPLGSTTLLPAVFQHELLDHCVAPLPSHSSFLDNLTGHRHSQLRGWAADKVCLSFRYLELPPSVQPTWPHSSCLFSFGEYPPRWLEGRSVHVGIPVVAESAPRSSSLNIVWK